MTMATLRNADVYTPKLKSSEPSIWYGTIISSDGKSADLVYHGFANSAAEIITATRSAATCARSTIAFSRGSVLDAQIAFESADVTAGRPNKKPLDPRKILDIGGTRYSFSPDFNWNGENHLRLDFWSHELVVSAHAFYPAPPQHPRKPNGKNSRRASTERTIVPLMESVLRTDPAVRLALAADRVLFVKWGAGFFPGLPFDRSDVCAARFAVWDASENTFIKVGNPAAIAMLALALRTRNLSVRTQGTLNFAREFPLRLSFQSATLAAALKSVMVNGGQGVWRKHRRVLNYLKRLGLTDLANELKAQADAPAGRPG